MSTEVTTKLSKKSWKRFFSLFLALCLCLTLVQPSSLFAEAAEKVTGITLKDGGNEVSSLTLKVGAQKDITATLISDGTKADATPGDATAGDASSIKWEITKGEAQVELSSPTGAETTITAKAEGSATIKASVKNVSAELTVTVEAAEVVATGVKLNTESLKLEVDGSETLKVEGLLPKGTTDEIDTTAWSSDQEAVAKVDTTGKVTGVAAGNTTITATVTTKSGNKVTGTCKVEVTAKPQQDEPAQTVAVTGVTVSPTTLDLKVNESKKLTATVAPADATNQKVSWATSDAKIATVDAEGNVKAVAAGSAKITVTTEDGKKTAECAVTVTEPKKDEPAKEVAVTGIKLNKNDLSLEVGASETLTATVEPANATNSTVTWKTSDEKIAKVEGGKVTAVAAGSATITATAGGKEATCKVTVTEKKQEEPKEIAVEKVKLNKDKVTINKGKTYKLKATVTPSDAKNKTLTWSSSKKSVATVDKNGKVTAKKAGTATITVKSANGKKDTCKVTVKVPATKITLNDKDTKGVKNIYVVKGKSAQLSAVVTPSDTTDSVKWSTSKKSVATVSKKGKVTAKAVGTATITAKAGSKKATVKVHVVKKAKAATSIKLNKKAYTIKVGKTYTLKPTVKPATTTQTISWSSSNKKVATVDAYGKVTAKKAGKATITAKIGSKKATCKITVKEVAATSIKLNKTKYTMKVGKTYTLKATVKPKDTTQKITWSTSKKSVATVDKNGKVTAKKKGTATITAKIGKKKATCKITVK